MYVFVAKLKISTKIWVLIFSVGPGMQTNRFCLYVNHTCSFYFFTRPLYIKFPSCFWTKRIKKRDSILNYLSFVFLAFCFEFTRLHFPKSNTKRLYSNKTLNPFTLLYSEVIRIFLVFAFQFWVDNITIWIKPNVFFNTSDMVNYNWLKMMYTIEQE